MTFTTKAELRRQIAHQGVQAIEQAGTIKELTAINELRRSEKDVLDRRITELEQALKIDDTHIKSLTEDIGRLRGSLASNQQEIRLKILQALMQYGRERELGQFSGWVLNGTAPIIPQFEKSPEPKKVSPENIVAGRPPVSREVVEGALEELLAVSNRISLVLADPNLSIGKVRLQNIGSAIGKILIGLREGL